MTTPPKITFITFGGTGDLAKRKLVPAFAKLVRDKTIAKDSLFVGIGRSEFTNESYKKMLLDFQDVAKRSEYKEIITPLNITYFKADVTKPDTFETFLQTVQKDETNVQSEIQGRIFYLAVGFDLFSNAMKVVAPFKEHHYSDQFLRVVFEKPFGNDLKSHDKFEENISKHLRENEVYRIDHYLGKETIANLQSLKFENPMIEAVLNNKHVKEIKIIVDEDLDLGKRIHYYDEFGAVKDMIQSHLLQVLALLLIKRPKTVAADEIHKEKEIVLKSLQLTKPQHQLLGQFKTYVEELKEFGLKESKTETFAKLELKSNLPEWQGVPLILRTGKNLEQKYGQIIITLQHDSTINCAPNIIEINIQPEQDINLYLNIGRGNFCERIKLDFCHSCHFGPNTSDGYEVMLADVVKGDHTMFTTVQENRASWRIVEEVLNQKENIPFVIYDKGSDPEKITTK